jgi:poly-gamma-glutamate synthesis protein (capsule biosynthesis protein)
MSSELTRQPNPSSSTAPKAAGVSDRQLLLAVGDIMIDRPKPEEALANVSPVFRTADVVFGNCESVYSERGERHPNAPGAKRAHPRNGYVLGPAGFTVMATANNHMPDFGPEAQADTLAILREQGILTVGAGPTLDDARVPAIATAGGVRIGFLAYASVVPPGYDASRRRSGIAPLRAHTVYEEIDVGQPGTRPAIHTFAYHRDIDALKEDITKLRERVDVLVVSIHWGIHFLPAVVADYEHEMAVAAIDAGADLILGHHQHILKGIEVYKGKVIFHGLGNFVGDLQVIGDVLSEELLRVVRESTGEYTVEPRPGYPSFPFHPESRQTIIVGCTIRDGAIDEVAFLPCLINGKGQPTPQQSGEPGWKQVAEYVEKITRRVGFNARFGRSRTLGDAWVAIQ